MGKERTHPDSSDSRTAYTYSLKHSFGIPENDKDALVAVAKGNMVRIFAESSKKDLASTLHKSVADGDDSLIRGWCARNARKDSAGHSLDLLRTIRKIMINSRQAKVVETDLRETDKSYELGAFLGLMAETCCYVKKGRKDLTIEGLAAFQLLEYSMGVISDSIREGAMMGIISSGIKDGNNETPIILLGAYHIFNLNKRLHEAGLNTIEMNRQISGPLRYGLLVHRDAKTAVQCFIPIGFVSEFLEECSKMVSPSQLSSKSGAAYRAVEGRINDFVGFLLSREKLTERMYYAVLNLSAIATFERLLSKESGTLEELKEEQTIRAYTTLGALYDRNGRISAGGYERVLFSMLRRLSAGDEKSGNVIDGYVEGLRALAWPHRNDIY